MMQIQERKERKAQNGKNVYIELSVCIRYGE